MQPSGILQHQQLQQMHLEGHHQAEHQSLGCICDVKLNVSAQACAGAKLCEPYWQQNLSVCNAYYAHDATEPA